MRFTGKLNASVCTLSRAINESIICIRVAVFVGRALNLLVCKEDRFHWFSLKGNVSSS